MAASYRVTVGGDSLVGLQLSALLLEA